MQTKRIVFVVFILFNILAMAPFAKAMPDPFATLVVWPSNTPEDSEGPMVTTSPADLVIYNNDNNHVLDDLWLMLVINEDTFNNLGSISTNTSLNFASGRFEEIDGSDSPSDRIPPVSHYSYNDWINNGKPAPYADMTSEGWPGIEWNDQYDVGSLRSKLGVADGESMYYSVGDLDNSTGWHDDDPPGLNKGDPEFFTLTVDVGGFGGNWKVLVLALGHSDDWPDHPILNVHSPYTKGTLVIVSEPGTILIALAFLSVFGLYITKNKMKKKYTQEF